MKVNPKLKRFLATCLLLIGGYFLCVMLYIFLDYLMNGFVREWFDRNYVYHEWVPFEGEPGYYYTSIRWWKLKNLMFRILIVAVILEVLIIRLISILYAARQEKKMVAAVGRMIGDYMRHDRELSEVFPEGFAPVSAQMAEIKADVQRQEQLQRAEESRKNDLITYLAHDLRTPLTSVIGYLSLLEEAPDMPGEQKEKYVRVTLNKALRLEKLINEFFEITRYNLHQIILEKETVNLYFMLVQMTDEFFPLLNAHGNTIRLEVLPGRKQDGTKQPENDITVYADGEKLARVFNNILKNAIAYSYPDTEIRVLCRREKENVRIVFSNRGKTIPEHKLEAIFEKFYRMDDARSGDNGGAGLGLAIAKEIVTLHGGTITAESRDEIISFCVTLPMIQLKYSSFS